MPAMNHILTQDHVKRLIRRVSIAYDVKRLETNTSLKNDDFFDGETYISFDDGEWVILPLHDAFDVYRRVVYPSSMWEDGSEDYKPIHDRKLRTLNDVALVILEDAIKEHVNQVEIDENGEALEAEDTPF